MSETPTDPVAILESWTEKDLSKAALDPLYERDDVVLRALGIMASGRSLMVIGPPGTGKTALVHELVRRAAEVDAVPALRGRRVVQISLRAILTTLKKPAEDFGPAFSQLLQAMFSMRAEIVPFIRDAALAYRLDLESQLLALAEGMDGPVILEGEENAMKALLEYEPAIAQAYLPLVVDEPSLAVVERIVARWSEDQDTRIEPEAQRMAVELCHRFLARDRFPRKALQLLDQAAHTRPVDHVEQGEVLDHFCRVHQVPRHLVDPDMPLDLSATERHFRDRLLGQNDAVAAVIQMIALVKSGLSDVRRPFGVFLFVGPTGVGKTHLAQLLADYLFGSPDRLIRLNMADFQSPQDALSLFGNPEHHRLSVRRGIITARLAGHPFAVLLFDELEKAHQSVIDRFLQLMDEGAFINGAGELVSCRSTILIATSNAGAQVYGGRMVGFSGKDEPGEMDRRVDQALESSFRREFLNRFDQVVHFRPLTRTHIRDIARRELRLLRERPGLARRDLHLEVDEPVLDWLTAHGYDPRHGARFLRRVVERHVATAVARALVRDNPSAGQTVRLTVRHGAIQALPVDLPPPSLSDTRLDDTVEADGDWLSRARAVLSQAEPLRQELAEARAQRSALLERINDENFWKSNDRVDVLARFRALDVQVEGDQRDAAAIERLEERVEAGTLVSGSVRAAESALLTWQERRALDSADRVWLVLSRGEALDSEADPFLADLLQILEMWCRRCGLDAERAAVHRVGGQLQRVVLDVHGPAAEAMLGAEVGLHRLHRTDGPDRRVAVAVVPVGGADTGEVFVEPCKRRLGPFDIPLHARAQAEQPGQTLTLEGPVAEIVEQATADLIDAWDSLHPTEIVRIYAADGVGARDPRTGASVKRFKDLRRGRLDAFRDAWQGA